MPFKNKPELYGVWTGLRARCNSPSHKAYKDYGGRGITVCARWNVSFSAFIEDMGPRPDGAVIDRIDNDKGYEPGNCRWTTRKTNQRNRRVTRWVTIEGTQHKAADLAELSGLKTDTIIERAELGLTYKEVMDPERRIFVEGLALGGRISGDLRAAKTHCKRGHPFDTRNTLPGPRNTRLCKSCWAWRKGVGTAPYPTPMPI